MANFDLGDWYLSIPTVNGELTGTLAVNHVPTSGDKEQRGKVIVSQIHATNDEPFRLYYRKLPNHSKGVLYFAHEPRRGSEKWFAMIGRDSGDGIYLHRKDYREPKDGITLNEKFSYKVKVVNDTLTVTIMRPGKRDVVQKVDMKGSGFNSSDQYMYFKVGAYNHNNTGKSKDYSKVTYYAFDNKHTGYSQPNKTPALSSSSYLINCGGKDFYDDKGKYFMADKYFRGGNTYSTATGIDGTINDTLYQTERYGRNLSYAFPVKNGEYSVKLLFSEIYFSQNNKRVFDVELENRIIYDDFDIHRQVGADTAIYSSFNTNVNDGVLNLDFNASIDNAKISAIEIIPR